MRNLSNRSDRRKTFGSGARAFCLALALFAAGAGHVHADALREHLSVFFEFNALDSVVALEQKSATELQVTVADGATGETRNLRENVGAKPMQKLLTEANDLGLKTIPLSAVPRCDVRSAFPIPDLFDPRLHHRIHLDHRQLAEPIPLRRSI